MAISRTGGDGAWVPLSIGAIHGGVTSTAVEQGFRQLASCVRRAVEAVTLEDVEAEASVNVVFHVPGNMIKPDYEGIRTSSWRGARRVQVMQVAVPEDLTDRSAVPEFLASSLVEAVDLAVPELARYKRSRHLRTDLARQVAVRAAAELLGNGP